MRLGLRDATPGDLAWVERAVRTCPVAMAELGGFYGRATERLAPLLGGGRRMLVVVEDGAGDPVGFVDVDPLDEPGAPAGALGLSWFVVPERRRRGVARGAVDELARKYPDAPLVVSVSAANAASLATARAAGFVDDGADEDGDLRLVRRPAPA